MKKFANLSKRVKKRIIIISTFVCIMMLLIIIPFSFAQLEPIKKVTIYGKNANYEEGVPGTWKIEKSGKWTSKSQAEITFEIDTERKVDSTATDVIIAIDTSGSMEGSRLMRMQEDSLDLVSALLKSSSNRIGLIGFSNTSNILVDLTDDEETLKNAITSLKADGETNYYGAFIDVDNMLSNYEKEKNRDVIVLFLTDGLPSVNTANEIVYARLLKEKYPWLVINGVQYEMGPDVLPQIENITDGQFVADIDTLNNVLLDASVPRLSYEEFVIEDYINTDYFTVTDESQISVTQGSVKFDKEEQKVIWNLAGLKSGLKSSSEYMDIKMVIKAKLKDDLVDMDGIYPTNKKEHIKSVIDGYTEDMDSDLTPILASKYQVNYLPNAPEGCEVTGMPENETQLVFDTVAFSEKVPKCEGYIFKGFSMTNQDVTILNKDYFIMPEENVQLVATWSKIGVKKSMDGKVYKTQLLYEMMRDSSISSDEGLNSSSKYQNGIYQRYTTADDKYPVYYYHGKVNNNVAFANFCWKIVRTTELGGTKLIYNGPLAEDGTCNNTGDSTIIKNDRFYSNDNSPAYVGYMFGNTDSRRTQTIVTEWYSLVGKTVISDEQVGSYYYSDSVQWDADSGYTLVSPQNKLWNDNFKTLQGYYTCAVEADGACSKIRYVIKDDSKNTQSSTVMKYVELENGETYESLYAEAEKQYIVFGNDVKWDSETSSYTLEDPLRIKNVEFLNQSLGKHHYTFYSDAESGTGVYYVYYLSDSSTYSLYLTGGENITDLLDRVVVNATNKTNSYPKKDIDDWYASNLDGTDDSYLLEDAIFCNDRSIYNYGSFDKDSTTFNGRLYFSGYYRNIQTAEVTCKNKNDAFTMNNVTGNGALKYPVGMLTADEVLLAGTGSNSYLYNGVDGWTMTPYQLGNGSAYSYFISSSGSLSSNYSVWFAHNVRPVISLVHDLVIESGDGTTNSPYHLTDVRRKYKVTLTANEEVSVDTEEAFGGRVVKLSVDNPYREIISFKVNGEVHTGDSFIMPFEDVEITDVVVDYVKVVETQHYPYLARQYDVLYYENTFEGVKSITVDLDYETYNGFADYVSIIGNNFSERYGGKPRTQTTLEIEGNYLKIYFNSQPQSPNPNYYGFKAVITLHY